MNGLVHRYARNIVAIVLFVAVGSAWAAGSTARPDGAASIELALFTTNGQLDAVFEQIDGGLWYSGGGPFTNIGAGIDGTAVQTFQAPTRDFIWAGTDAGLWVSFDRGSTWQARNTNLSCLNVTHTAVTASGSVYVATRCSGTDTVFRSFDRGVTWQQLPALPGSPQVNRLFTFGPANAVALTTAGRYRMIDTTTDWISDTTPTSTSPWRGVPEGSDLIDDSMTFPGGTTRVGLMLVRNAGPYRTEQATSNTSPLPPVTLQKQGLPSVSAFGSRLGNVNNEALVPVIGDGAYRFNTATSSWARVYEDSKVPGIEYVRDLYAGSPTLFATSRTNGLWRSTDSGATWQPFGLSGSAPAQTLVPVTPPPQTTFSVPSGQLPEAAVASVEASEDIHSKTLVVKLDLSKIPVAQTQSFAATGGYNVYVVAAIPGELLGAAAGTKTLFQRAATGDWGQLTSPMAAYAENVAFGAADQKVTVEIVRDTDVSGLIGTEIYIGYGTSDQEMLAASRYRGVYIVQ